MAFNCSCLGLQESELLKHKNGIFSLCSLLSLCNMTHGSALDLTGSLLTKYYTRILKEVVKLMVYIIIDGVLKLRLNDALKKEL